MQGSFLSLCVVALSYAVAFSLWLMRLGIPKLLRAVIQEPDREHFSRFHLRVKMAYTDMELNVVIDFH